MQGSYLKLNNSPSVSKRNQKRSAASLAFPSQQPPSLDRLEICACRGLVDVHIVNGHIVAVPSRARTVLRAQQGWIIRAHCRFLFTVVAVLIETTSPK
jgi:hypothetical protein